MAGKALLRWFDIRIGGKSEDIDRLMRKPIKGGARWMFSLGALNLYLFVNQMLTGIFLNLYYVPSPDHAYDAVKFIQSETDFGWLVRGLHFWGASAMIVSLMLHVTRVYTFGAYKKPRELMWLSGALLLLLTVGFAFTGYLLPWDQKAYWATVVGTNVAGTAPVLGPYIVKVLRGGAEISNFTLTRFFTIHTMFLPWTLAAVAAFHLTLQQLVDHTPPWNPEKAKVVAPFFPDQVLKDMVAALGVFVLLIVLAYSAPPTLEALADPTDKTYNPRPEWYFYFLFQLLRYFEGRLEIVGTMVIPNLFVVVLLALPFIDRNPELNPRKRPVAMSALVFVLAGYIALTLLASVSPPKGASAAAGSPAPGRLLYAKLGCGTCHSIAGAGGKVGPPLDGVGKRREAKWIAEHFKDPQKLSPGSVMPKYDNLSARQLEDLTNYMVSLK